MPDKRRHRGPHPLDATLFAPDQIGALCGAIADFSWLLERDYAAKSALQLVGNRFGLHERQRLAVLRCSCAASALQARLARAVEVANWRGQAMQLDGYNVLMTVEAALGGGVMLRGRDGCLRDMASLHGNFRSVEETAPAATQIGEFLERCGVNKVVWWLDSPVSNSGRLKSLLAQIAAERAWNWEVHLAFDADAALKKLDADAGIVASADSVVLDNVSAWANLGRALVEAEIADAWVLDLSGQREL